MQLTTSFSIENLINPETQQPFGAKYAGTFNLRRQSLQDRNVADIRKAAILNAYGTTNFNALGEWTLTSTSIYCTVCSIATEKLPDWFDYSKIYDESDEAAVLAVWEEVQKFLKSFRPDKGGDAGKSRSQESKVLVQE